MVLQTLRNRPRDHGADREHLTAYSGRTEGRDSAARRRWDSV